METAAYKIRYSALSVAFVVAVFFASLPAHADNLYASIRGSVTDQSGAVIGDVTVTATNVATGASFASKSGKDGAYSFPQLPIGDYLVRTEQSGFKKFETRGIHLDLNQVYTLDIHLEVGTVSEVLTVEANAAQVNTTDMQVANTISGSQIVDMPLNGRNWTQLQQLEPGVVASSDRFGTYATNGSTTQQNAFLINGTDTNDSSLNDPLIIPSPDAIGEFNIVTSTLNPEYGRNSGAILNAAIKSGTNQFHGDAFEFYRDTFLDAKAWFQKQASPFHQNEYGGTFGGPVAKDHTFFFFSYQGLHERVPQSASVPTVYSAAERGGDFSADAGGFSTNPIPVAMFGDSSSTCPVSGGTPCAANGKNTYAQLFSTGVIPAADLNPLAVKLTNQFVPLPNAAGNSYDFNPITTETSNQYIYRLDEKIREQDSLWFYGLWASTPSQDSLPFTGATVPGFSELAARHYQEYTTAWNHSFSSSTLNEARFAYLRFNFDAVVPVSPINPTSYGFTGIVPQTATDASLPVMTVSGLFTLGFSANGPQPRIQNTYQATDNFTKVVGRHSLKLGFSMERLEINNPFFANLGGNFSFNGTGPFTTGIPGADFLLGVPASYSQGSGSTVRGRGREYYSYFQDQWKVSPSLTLTLGTGWDIETPWRNLFDNGLIMGAWRPGQQSTVFPTMPAGFVFPGDQGINEYGGPTVHYADLAPRVGFAWSPGSHKWSLRGGYGLYYNRSEEELTLQTLQNAPFALGAIGGTQCGSPVFATPFVGYNAPNPTQPQPITTCNITQAFPFRPPSAGSSFNPAPFEPIGFNFTTLDPRVRSPRVTNMSLTFEYQLSPSTVVSLGYAGSLGRYEEGAVNGNIAGQAPGVNPAAAAAGCSSGLGLAFAPCPQTALGAPSVPGATPYNMLVYGQPGIENSAYNSNYNSLQLEFNRHFSNGLQVLAAYTYSRNFDETSNFESNAFNFPGLNPFSAAYTYGPSANDAPQRFVVSYVYTLPIYKYTHRLRALTDGWNISGIYTLQHGFPIGVFDLSAPSLTCDDNGFSFFSCPDRPNRTNVPLNFVNPRTYQAAANGGTGPAGSYWFTNGSSVFVSASAGNMGNANRNPLYGPGINYGDTAIEKNIYLSGEGESRYIQLRFETFNTFNHANFASPATPGFVTEDAASFDASVLGRISKVNQLTTNGSGRVVQLGAKFYF